MATNPPNGPGLLKVPVMANNPCLLEAMPKSWSIPSTTSNIPTNFIPVMMTSRYLSLHIVAAVAETINKKVYWMQIILGIFDYPASERFNTIYLSLLCHRDCRTGLKRYQSGITGPPVYRSGISMAFCVKSSLNVQVHFVSPS